MLHEDRTTIGNNGPKEGRRRSLCSNKTDKRRPSLGDADIWHEVHEDEALDYLASLIVEVFLYQKQHEWIKQQKK